MSELIVAAIIQKFGTQERLADALETRQSTVAMWKKRGIIPARQQERVLAAAKSLGIALSPSDFFESSRNRAA